MMSTTETRIMKIMRWPTCTFGTKQESQVTEQLQVAWEPREDGRNNSKLKKGMPKSLELMDG